MFKRGLLFLCLISLIQSAFAIEPDALFERANDAFVARDYKEAKDLFQKYLTLFPEGEDRTKAQYFVGESLYQLGSYGDAIDAFQKVVDQYPETPLAIESLNRIGDAFLKLGNPDGALMVYERVVKEHPDTHQAEYARYSISWIKRPDLRIEPTPLLKADVLIQKAKTSFLKKDYTKAREEFLEFLKAFPDDPLTPYAKLKVAECDYYLGNYEDALKGYEEVVKRWGESKWADYAQYSIGWCHYRKKDYEKAMEAFGQLRKMYPRSRYIGALDEIEPRVRDEARKREMEKLYRSAKSDYVKGNLASSYKKFEDLINRYPDSPYIKEAKITLSKIKERMHPEAERLYKEASSLHQAGGYKDAIERYRRLISQYPGSEYAELAKRGLQLIMEEMVEYEAGELWTKAERAIEDGRYEEATSLYQEIINNYPTTTYAKRARVNVNRILLQAENLKAEEIYKRALSYSKEGKFLEAIEEFDKIILTYPKSDYVEPAKEGILSARRSLFELQAKRRYELGNEYLRLGDWEKAIDEFQNVRETYPKTIYAEKAQVAIDYIAGLKSEKEAEEIYNLARRLYNEGKVDEAFNEFRRLIDTYPESTYTEPAREALSKISKEMMGEASKELYDKGREQQRMGEYEDALHSYDALLTRYPTSHWAPYAQYAKGEIYYVKEGDYRRAITEWTKVVENYPEHELAPHALYHVGECYEKLKEWDRARAIYKRLVEEYPESMYGKGELAQFIRAFLASEQEGIRD
jgi:tol-pal system protein YbgF